MPPRCNPIAIVIIVLSLGMLFIGLTMTIIANWPGATSIGENPLKIAGPVLLAAGGAIFILGIALTCCLNNRERRKWEQSLASYAAQRRYAMVLCASEIVFLPLSFFYDKISMPFIIF